MTVQRSGKLSIEQARAVVRRTLDCQACVVVLSTAGGMWVEDLINGCVAGADHVE